MLLWRLQNGEMPKTLQPKVWWLLIGTNDAHAGCTPDVVVAGNLRILQELRQHSPDTPIVINSLLPRGPAPLLANQNVIMNTLRAANQQLACYAAQTPGVYFANLTDMFTEVREKERLYIKKEFYNERDWVHPSPEGNIAWEDYMVERVQKMIEGGV